MRYSESQKFKFEELAGEFAVCSLPMGGEAIPSGAFFLSRIGGEASLICEEGRAPQDAIALCGGWRGFRVAGKLDFALTGVVAGVTEKLAAREIPVLACATHDTDCFFVKGDRLSEALRALRGSGEGADRGGEGDGAIAYREVADPAEKSAITDMVLRSLPDWFGIEEAIVSYVGEAAGLTLFAAFEGGAPVGFAALKRHGEFASEVCVMGVLARLHREGIGRRLIALCEADCASRGNLYMTVKTLDEAGNSPEYDLTRAFYRAMGFLPIEVFKTLWDESNPCLLMIKRVG